MTAPLGPVLVVGCGLMGTSAALALRRAGTPVFLSDLDPRHIAVAESLGAGSSERPDTVDLAVVAVPPAQVAEVVAECLARWPAAVVTDLASVKSAPLESLVAAGVDVTRYVGGHPMAGSERSGPIAASAQLFEGRPWAVTAHPSAAPDAVAAVRALAEACGATVVAMNVRDHDAAVARVSHLPHVMSVLTAGQLSGSAGAQLALAGQGLRDVTRIAGSDPVLWNQILEANSAEVALLLRSVRDQIDRLLAGDVLAVLELGRQGIAAIPGKHGGVSRQLVTVFVQVPDEPGQLARLFADAEAAGVNVEDLRLDHDLGRPVGLVEVDVGPERADTLVAALADNGWSAYR